MPGWNRSHSLWSSFTIGKVHYLLLDSEASATKMHTGPTA